MEGGSLVLPAQPKVGTLTTNRKVLMEKHLEGQALPQLLECLSLAAHEEKVWDFQS